MTNETSSLWARIEGVERILNSVLQRLSALEVRVAAVEQQLAQRWYS